MRDHIGILWVDDVQSSYEAIKETLELYALDRGIKLNFRYIQNADTFLNALESQETGFQQYDICFIDYALSMSDDKMGDIVVKKLKDKKINADVLFYSSDRVSDIREIIKDDISSFEGVYISDRHNFDDKAKQLINKNAKKMYSINNIRGVLMNETSENDYIMKSYIIDEYESIDDAIKTELTANIKTIVSKKIKKLNDDAKKINEKSLFSTGNEIIKISNDLLSLSDRYIIFEKLLSNNTIESPSKEMFKNYIERLVVLRNNLAHRKLEICDQGGNILHYNHIKDYRDKHCQVTCQSVCRHTEDNKVSKQEWDDLRKQLIEFGECMDQLIQE